MGRQPLETWVHKSGRVVLLGDACHPMLVSTIPILILHLIAHTYEVASQPYRAQGAAMAIEDAAVLGNLFSRLTHHAQIAPLLHAYQDLRLPRTAATQASSRLNQHIFHLPDGPDQEQRDADMRRAMEAELRLLDGEDVDIVAAGEGSYNQWADRKKNEEQFGYDADAAAEQWWADFGEWVVGSLGVSEADKEVSVY